MWRDARRCRRSRGARGRRVDDILGIDPFGCGRSGGPGETLKCGCCLREASEPRTSGVMWAMV